MPAGSTVISYGQLSEEKIGPVDPIVFLFKSQRIEPFLLPYWLLGKNVLGQLSAINASKPLIQNITVSKCFALHEIKEAIEFYKNNMTDGKVFLKSNEKIPGKDDSGSGKELVC